MPRQSGLRFTLNVAEGPAFEVVRFVLTEAVSQPFRLELSLSSPQDVDPDALLDTDAVFTLQQHGNEVRAVHGIITAFAQESRGFRRRRYRMVIEPTLARLRLWHGSRIHQQLTGPGLLAQRLKERGLDAGFDVSREHPMREYCVQHRETDADFFDRLAAEEGLLYYFDPLARSRCVLTDALQSAPRLSDDEGVIYRPNPGDDAERPSLWQFDYERRLAPTRALRRDYTFKNPHYNLEHGSPSRDGVGGYAHYDAPGRYKADATGRQFAARSLAALRSDATLAHLAGDDARLWPGLRFALTEAPSETLGRDWRVIAMRHEGEQSAGQEEDGFDGEHGSRYAFTAEAVPAALEWKPALLPRPVMDGPQMAHVVGPPGEEIHTDEHGRVMVWFPWDREGPKENSTCWLRVSQGWAGSGYGMLALPRVGHEVIVDFLDGDPDQPIVTGRTFHAVNRAPYALPALKTQSTLRSSEHKGSGHNELLIDDTRGQIKAQLHSSHGATQLNLGFLTHARGRDGEGVPRGEGFELRTDAAGALRAAHGLLLSAYQRAEAASGQLDHRELMQCVQSLAELTRSLLDTAAQHQAPAADPAARDGLLQAVGQLGAGANDRREDAAGGPVIAISAPDGIVAATSRSLFLGSGEQAEVVAQGNAVVTAGQRVHVTAGKGIAQFAFAGGLQHIAHNDHIDVQAQHGQVRIQAAQAVRVTASEGHVVVNAKERITLMCGGAYLTLSEGNIELGCPGDFTVKAAGRAFVGPASASEAMNEWKQANFDDGFQARLPDGTPLANKRYLLTRADGARIPGVTDAEGIIHLQKGMSPEGIGIEWLHDSDTNLEEIS